MKTWSFLGAAVMIAGLFLPAAPSFAHHSFAAEFDDRNCKDFTGILTKLDWQSPHPYFFMDVKDASGKVDNWSFQTYAPITLRRNGTDRQLFIAIKNGGPAVGQAASMPAYKGQLSDAQIGDVVAYLRSLAAGSQKK